MSFFLVCTLLLPFAPVTQQSLADFENTLVNMNSKAHVDYRQLGLALKLYACEVHHNMLVALRNEE